MLQLHFSDERLEALATFARLLPLPLLLFVAPCRLVPAPGLRPPAVRTWPATPFFSLTRPASPAEEALLAPWYRLLGPPARPAEVVELAAGTSLLLVEALWRLDAQLAPTGGWHLAGLHQLAAALDVWLHDGQGFVHLRLQVLPTGQGLWGEVVQAYATGASEAASALLARL